jgi:predicted translin family RNA/ssDNA-binding protein
MIKLPDIVRLKRIYLNIIKGIYEKLMAIQYPHFLLILNLKLEQ